MKTHDQTTVALFNGNRDLREFKVKQRSIDHKSTAEIVPFPLARRRRYVLRQAEVIAGMRTDAGERYLKRQLLTQFDALDRRGVACDVIEREVLALDSAIRAELWRTILTPGCS